jgi:kynurenine formamidase
MPSIERILDASSDALPRSLIQGFASINYRLSPHPDFPQDGNTIPARELRVARHPDHIRDVWSALAFLTLEYGIRDRYVLVGHSVGATLAFQLLMGSEALIGASPPTGVALPACVIGVAGMYGFYDLNARHGGAYKGIFAGAFGDDEHKWDDAAPACFRGNFRDVWKGGRLALLACSTEDGLIDGPEIDSMAAVLKLDHVECVVKKDVGGEHDFAWRDGTPIARLVVWALEHLRSSLTQ